MTDTDGQQRSESFVLGALWSKVVERTQTALACGALQPISTSSESIEQNDLNFIVRVSSNLARKEAAGNKSQEKKNPFLPYEQDLFVADLSATHVALLNKFNVVDHHFLMITRHFERQESWLTLSDFSALAISLAAIDGLAFYNGGQAAGASQGHKHLQLVPLPLCEKDGLRMPLEVFLTPQSLKAGQLDVPFLHSVVPLSIDWMAAPQTIAMELSRYYRCLYAAVGLTEDDTPQPYNLLTTRRWMLLVPRLQESHACISVNALGFAGSLFVRDRNQLDQLKQLGPMSLLQAVTYPR